MADSFIVAPSVQWTETDLTLATTSGLTQLAALVGEFAWGEAENPVRISSGETGLVSNFWKPTTTQYLDFLVMADFFRYSKSAMVCRALKPGALNAIPTTGDAMTVKNAQDLEDYAGNNEIFARYPGALGNNLNTYVMDSTDLATAKQDYADGFRSGLAYLYTLLNDKSDLTADETYHLFVFDETGALSGTTPTDYPDRVTLSITWPGDAQDGIYLGNQTGTSRILLQWPNALVAPTDDTELVTELVRQFNEEISSSKKRLNNIRAIRLTGTADIEVEFYTDMGTATWYASAGTAFTAVTATPVVITDYGSYLESFEHLSIIEGAKKFDGSTAYYVDYVNPNSSWIGCGPAFGTSVPTGFIQLRNGSDGAGDADYQSCYDILNVKTNQFLALIGQGQLLEYTQAAIDLSVSKRTSVTFVSPPAEFRSASRKTKMSVLRNWRNNELLRDNSYFFMDDNWGYVYDSYNNVYRWIPCCGGTAGLWFRSISNAGIGKSPAFYNRGKYLGYKKMAWSANDDERSEVYNELGINSIVTEKEGIILMGEKTGLSKKSAFSRLPTRGVFIEAEVNISDTAKYVLGENNDTFTQASFRLSVEPYLRKKKESGEILDYRVKCDETNNDAQVLVENKFVAGIWIKPQYVIDWVLLDFVALRPDMEFSELEGAYSA
jgi:hypothetical protein